MDDDDASVVLTSVEVLAPQQRGVGTMCRSEDQYVPERSLLTLLLLHAPHEWFRAPPLESGRDRRESARRHPTFVPIGVGRGHGVLRERSGPLTLLHGVRAFPKSRNTNQRPLVWKSKCRGPSPEGREISRASIGDRTPARSSKLETKIRSSPRSVCSTKRPDAAASIWCARGFSCPLRAKLPGGAFVAVLDPTVPTSFLMSLAGPRLPSARIGSTATEPRW
jgi:hypothetical protein